MKSFLKVLLCIGLTIFSTWFWGYHINQCLDYKEAGKNLQAIASFVSMCIIAFSSLVCIVRSYKDTKSGFGTFWKNHFSTILIFSIILYTLFMVVWFFIAKVETSSVFGFIGYIIGYAIIALVLSFLPTLLSVCLTILLQAIFEGYKLYKEIKEVVTDTNVKLFTKIFFSIISKGVEATRTKQLASIKK